MLKPFNVWLHPLSDRTCRVRVEGRENANWLLARLSTAYITKTSESMLQKTDSAFCTFDVLYPRQYSHYMLEELLESFPPVQLKMGFGMSPTRTENTTISEQADQ